jgi:hypothetical protein
LASIWERCLPEASTTTFFLPQKKNIKNVSGSQIQKKLENRPHKFEYGFPKTFSPMEKVKYGFSKMFLTMEKSQKQN